MSTNTTLKLPCPTGQISDGYHTFDELYLHRHSLFIALMACNPDISWFSRWHHNGSTIDGWFIAGMHLPTGDVTYHLPNKLMELVAKSGIKQLDQAPKWDGHTSDKVAFRFQEWASSDVRTPNQLGSGLPIVEAIKETNRHIEELYRQAGEGRIVSEGIHAARAHVTALTQALISIHSPSTPPPSCSQAG